STSWNLLASQGNGDGPTPVNYVIVNAGCEATSGGSGSRLACVGCAWLSNQAIDDNLQQRIAQLTANAVRVFGYVDLPRGHDPNQVIVDLQGWAQYGGGARGFFEDTRGTK